MQRGKDLNKIKRDLYMEKNLGSERTKSDQMPYLITSRMWEKLTLLSLDIIVR